MLVVTEISTFTKQGIASALSDNRMIATAILDRLLHYGITVTICGDSYRLKETIRAGLLKGAEATA